MLGIRCNCTLTHNRVWSGITWDDGKSITHCLFAIIFKTRKHTILAYINMVRIIMGIHPVSSDDLVPKQFPVRSTFVCCNLFVHPITRGLTLRIRISGNSNTGYVMFSSPWVRQIMR